MRTSKICSKCSIEKSAEEFSSRSDKGRRYLASACRECCRIRDRAKKRPYVRYEASEAKTLARIRDERKNREHRAKYIITDCRASDRRKNLVFDLDRDFVDKLISKPCFYCDDADSQMTLDRIENSIGHVRSNVVQSCYRCNLVRGSMPYDAWMHLCEGMKRARESGAFGEWRTKPFNR